MNPIDWDVVIAGAGPTGLALANHLGVLGVRTLVVEQLAELIDYPRGVGIDDEALRSFQAAGLVDAMPMAAVDATGLQTRHVSAHFGLRRAGAGHRQQAWPKLTAVVHTASHLIVGAVPGTGLSQDSPDFAPAMRQAAELISFDTALADAGYDAEHNHHLCREELGLRQSVIALNPRNAGQRPPTTPYRHALWQDFPSATYHQRWHVESTFSQHKRRLGSALSARRSSAQHHELVLRVLTHNLALLAASACRFQQSIPSSKRVLPSPGFDRFAITSSPSPHPSSQ